MLEFFFWLLLFVLIYVCFGYPLVAAVLSRRKRPVLRDDAHLPTVSLLIPAYNEAAVIEETLRDKLALDYPADRLEILVVSDASDDGTDEIVTRVGADSNIPIQLVRQLGRQGKTAGINRLVEQASGEILAFADANSVWARDALARLVRNFADPEVGYVTGKMVYTNPDGSLVGDGCSSYMRYENWLRERETDMGSVVGVDGGIDAMRRPLYSPLRADQLPDFVQPLKVVEQGSRVVYEPEAQLREAALQDGGSEFSMRVRVTLRALWALKDMAHLMNPLRDPLFAFQLVSHKLLRYLGFVPLVLLALINLALLNVGTIYVLTAAGQAAFYILAYQGYRTPEGQPAPVWRMVPYYFSLLNIACARAVLSFCRGERKVTWTPRQG
ncbi:MAG: glycosyltransferase family 2 protein [Aquisalimonadaceae bacterium]